MRLIAFIIALVANVSAKTRSSPPAGAVTVCTTGDCEYNTVGAATRLLFH